MGHGLGRLVDRAEAAVFQGRQAELAAVLGRLAEPARLPGVMALTGPPGIGKTAVVYALARICGTGVLILDSRDFPHTLNGLREAASRIPADRPSLLVFDTFEEMRDIEDQFWERFLPEVSGPVLVLLSGRHAPVAGLRATGWRRVVDELCLAPLPDDQSRRLLADLGVMDEAVATAIVDRLGGNPLLLCVAAEVCRSGGTGELSGIAVPGEIARTLIARMSRELRRPDVRELLQAASLVRTFDEELLTAMIGRDTTDAFDALCDLSVVRMTPAGARVHDVVRQTLAAELRWRAPERYTRLRTRAASYLLARQASSAPRPEAQANSALRPEAQANSEPQSVVPELLHLVGESIGPRRFFAEADDRGVRLRPARDERGHSDLAALERICLGGTHNFGWQAGQRLRELRADFPVAAEWFVVASNDGAPVAYSYSFPLHRGTLMAAVAARAGYFDALPASEHAAIANATPHAPAAFLIAGTVTAGSHQSAEPALRLATFTNRHVRCPGVSRSYLLLPQGSPFAATAASLGARRRMTGIELPEGSADEWILDYGERGFASWVQRWLNVPGLESVIDQMPDDVLFGEVKLALEDLYRPTSLGESPLVRLRCIDPADGPGLRALLLRLLDGLQQAEPARDREAAALLAAYYVKRVGSHEIIAQRLGLSRTTFYRRLSRGLELLAEQIRMTEALGGTETGTLIVPGSSQ
ncbi:MAG TPA: AAA family ATPase [Streptosporangiaceae bacterium]